MQPGPSDLTAGGQARRQNWGMFEAHKWGGSNARSYGPGAGVVARRLLPSHAPLLGDELEVAVPLRRRSLGRLARHRRRARQDDDGGLRVALGHVGVNTFLVVGAVRRDGGDRL